MASLFSEVGRWVMKLLSIRVGSLPHSQTLGLTKRLASERHSSLIGEFVIYEEKSIANLPSGIIFEEYLRTLD